MRPRTAIIVAALVVFVVGAWVPFGDTALYPLTLFTTWVHEMGHGLAALLMGGSFDSLEIRWGAGGTAYSSGVSSGFPRAFTAASGLLAPPLLGAAILAFIHNPRRARITLAVIAAVIVLSLIVWVRSAAGLTMMPLVAALLGWAAWRGFAENPERRVLLAQTLGVMLALDTVTRMVSYAFSSTARPGSKSDVARIADHLGGHYLMWGLVITVVALGLLALGLWWAWRRPEPTTATGHVPSKRL